MSSVGSELVRLHHAAFRIPTANPPSASKDAQREEFFEKAAETIFSPEDTFPLSEEVLPDEALHVKFKSNDYIYSINREYEVTHICLRSLRNLPHFNLVADPGGFKVEAAFIAKEGCSFGAGLEEIFKYSFKYLETETKYCSKDIFEVVRYINRIDDSGRAPKEAIIGLNHAVEYIFNVHLL